MDTNYIDPMKAARSVGGGGGHNYPSTEHDPQGLSPNAPGAKLDASKVDCSLLLDFHNALTAVAEVGHFGAKKYSRGGWLKVQNGQQRYTAALMWHLLAEQSSPLDADSGVLHAAHSACNALARLELLLRNEGRTLGIERDTI